MDVCARSMGVCPWTLVHVPKITILSQYIGNILPVSGCILTISEGNFLPAMGCLHFANIVTIIARRVSPFHAHIFNIKLAFNQHWYFIGNISD